nr:hypothetical protein [Lachnospiraceae bacterium]
ARIGDVYQLPLMLDGDRDCRWNINSTDKYCNNILIEAPNGYGKTTFMRSILLSATYEYRNDITPEEKHSYEVIRNYHGVDDSFLCVYIECKNINFDKPADAIDAGWIYENLSGIESIRIDKYVEKRDFEDLIRSYNLNRKLVLLIDGLDEIGADNRSKLIRLLSEFQQDMDCGSHSKVIMTSRPLFWKADFGEYKKYSISNRNIIEDKSVFLEYVKCYSKNYRPEDAERIYEYVTGNTYLRSIATTPAVIVWMIREFRRNGVFYESMERIIEQIMLRYKSRELTVYKEQYKRVYEELAHEYLRLQEGEEGLAYLEAEMLSLIKGCIETIKTEGNRRFNRVFEENKDDEELGELFLTNVALLEFDHGHVRFSNPVFACHLAARRILRSFREGCRFRTDEQLDVLPYRNRYHVMVIASSLALHLSDNRFFEDFGTNASDIRFDLEEAFYEYMRDRWDADGCDEEEKACIQEAVAHLLLCSYGDNVYTNSNMRNKDHILRLESILKTELKECPEAVLKYRSEKG